MGLGLTDSQCPRLGMALSLQGHNEECLRHDTGHAVCSHDLALYTEMSLYLEQCLACCNDRYAELVLIKICAVFWQGALAETFLLRQLL